MQEFNHSEKLAQLGTILIQIIFNFLLQFINIIKPKKIVNQHLSLGVK